MSDGSVVDEIRVFDRDPLIVVEFSGAPSDEQFAGYLREMESIQEKRSARWDRLGRSGKAQQAATTHARGAVLFDTTHSTRPVNARQRRMQADYMARAKATSPPESEATLGVCFVITNMMVRGVLTAILWLHPLSARYKVCATRREADEWCRRWVLGTALPSEPPAAVGG